MWLLIFGFVAITKILNSVFQALDRAYNNHLKSVIVGSDLRSTYGDWVVVTGPTSGIGKALARELASKGLNIILIARNEKKVQEVASNIESEYGVKTKYFLMDFSTRKPIAGIVEEIKKFDVGILVNNAGITLELLAPINEVEPSKIVDIINVNCGPAMELTALLLPHLKARSKPSLILNNSSTSALVPAVYLNIYSASKIFIDVWSEGLKREIGGSNVKLKIIRPLLVSTAMTDNCEYGRKNPIVVPAERFAKATCRTLFTDIASSGMPFSDVFLYLSILLPRGLAIPLYTVSFEIVRKQQLMERKKAR